MTLSLLILAGACGLIALAELVWPARPFRRDRWPLNLALGLTNVLLTRLLTSVGPLGAAHWARGEGVGLLNSVSLPLWADLLLVVLVMDLGIYVQHRAMHRIGWLWALHRLHHADTDFDVTTGVRFNPGEALLSLFYKSVLVLLLGAPPEAVLLFELYLALGSLFEHANLQLPARLDAALRRLWVTPAMHRIHHSAHGRDLDHNYCFGLALWDHLLGSYLARARGDRIGLPPR